MSTDAGTVEPDATVAIEVESDEPESSGDTVVIVDNSGGDSSDETADAVEEALTTERRFAEIERRLDAVESRSFEAVSYSEAAAIAEDAVAESAVVAEVVAEETAAETTEDVVEEIVEDTSPHKTHWLHRSMAEWLGKSGSGKVDKKG